MAPTSVSNVVVPAVYLAYLQAMTEVKSRLVQSGAVERDSRIDGLLQGGGITFNMPKWDDLADTDANVSLGATGSAATPLNVTSLNEIGVRLSRNQVWGSVDLAAVLAGDDPMKVIAERMSAYWSRELQRTFVAAMKGVFLDNTANDSADYTKDISGGAYSAGVTDFSASAFIDACHTMGDSEADLSLVAMHSVVYARAKKNDLIDFVSDSENPRAAKIATFLGREVIVDDGLPFTGNVYETWIFGRGAVRWGVGTPRVPLEEDRAPLDAGGGGSESLISRVEWCLHPAGHAYVGTPANGGPSNAASANNLAVAGSWDRRATQRKQVKIARLITREA